MLSQLSAHCLSSSFPTRQTRPDQTRPDQGSCVGTVSSHLTPGRPELQVSNETQFSRNKWKSNEDRHFTCLGLLYSAKHEHFLRRTLTWFNSISHVQFLHYYATWRRSGRKLERRPSVISHGSSTWRPGGRWGRSGGPVWTWELNILKIFPTQWGKNISVLLSVMIAHLIYFCSQHA